MFAMSGCLPCLLLQGRRCVHPVWNCPRVGDHRLRCTGGHLGQNVWDHNLPLLQFEENAHGGSSAIGTFVSADRKGGGGSNFGGAFNSGVGRESREITLKVELPLLILLLLLWYHLTKVPWFPGKKVTPALAAAPPERSEEDPGPGPAAETEA